ncbi:MAG: tetratricopeptide repeat protein [Spirochaetaceae bacterium]|jgi:tetratricopeptide (TPR) repeat protein|nr:tetratricopeptide repeat protein [Spirochaetaceae bacterium]
MGFLIPVLCVTLFVIAVSCGAVFIINGIKESGQRNSLWIKKAKTKEDGFREANKALSKNPKDPIALTHIGNYYFEEKDWENTYRIYETLADIPAANGVFNQAQVNTRAAIAAMELGNLESAHKFLAVARACDQNNYEISYYSGMLEFKRGNFEKAAGLLQQAVSRNGEHAPTLRALGHSLFKMKRPKEAMNYIRKAMEAAPNDKESVFVLAECYADSGQREQALRLYSHLRPDEDWGPEACLASGLIQIESHQDEAAIADFEIGLKHEKIKDDIEIELKYQLAGVYLRVKDINSAMKYLQQIKLSRPDYKDTAELIEQYRELSVNKNLQIFTLASTADFIALCRKIVMTYFVKAKVKITKTMMTGNDWSDILAEVDTQKWSSTVMFRFIRTQGTIGELVVRDFHSHLKEAKADKGICVGIGTYSDDAKKFTEARLIDLIDREKLCPVLSSLDAKLQ